MARHTLARTINAPYTGKDWETDVEKMMKKPRSGIDADSAKKIIEFLKYDSTVRKKEPQKQ